MKKIISIFMLMLVFACSSEPSSERVEDFYFTVPEQFMGEWETPAEDGSTLFLLVERHRIFIEQEDGSVTEIFETLPVGTSGQEHGHSNYSLFYNMEGFVGLFSFDAALMTDIWGTFYYPKPYSESIFRYYTRVRNNG